LYGVIVVELLRNSLGIVGIGVVHPFDKAFFLGYGQKSIRRISDLMKTLMP